MYCKHPVGIGINHYVPCGQCMPCRIKKRRLWASRIELEAQVHQSSAFVTLTYSDEKLPANGSLDPVHVKNWLKRIREAVEPLRLRHFTVGEYGDKSQRPHYHVGLFGYPICSYGTSNFNRQGHCCPNCDRLYKTWGYGFVHSSPLDGPQARYIAGYVTKKMTKKDDPRLAGRFPEFARMSLKPGIGAPAAAAIAQTLQHHLLVYDQDVPGHLKVGKEGYLLLGKYVRKKIREELGWKPDTPEFVKQEYAKKMQLLSDYAKSVGVSAKELLVEMNSNKMLRSEFFEGLRPERKI